MNRENYDPGAYYPENNGQAGAGYGADSYGYAGGYDQSGDGYADSYSQDAYGYTDGYGQAAGGYSDGYGQATDGYSQDAYGYTDGYGQDAYSYADGYSQDAYGYAGDSQGTETYVEDTALTGEEAASDRRKTGEKSGSGAKRRNRSAREGQKNRSKSDGGEQRKRSTSESSRNRKRSSSRDSSRSRSRRSNSGAAEETARMEIPSVADLREELERVRYAERFRQVLRSTVFTLVVVAAFAVLVATLWMPVLRIYGVSMAPTLDDGHIVVSVKESEFKPGDIVAFYYNNKILVKRAIAKAGEWVDIDERGNVYVNNRILDEPYLTEKDYGDCNIELPYQVPEGRIFVLGDNRDVSVDSRNTAVGCVAEEQIVGKLVFKVWPLKAIGPLSGK